MKIILAATAPSLASAWSRHCAGLDRVTIHHGSILDVACDAMVSPANSFGFMDGGIDALYMDAFGSAVQDRVRHAILSRHHGELLIGNADIVETGDDRARYLIAAPTMRVPMVLPEDTVNPYLATRAVLLLLRHGRFPDGKLAGQKISGHIGVVAFPGLGTGVGRVPAEIAARQMRAAIDDHRRAKARLPTSWAEASERHQQLYTTRPGRLQI
jgi:O-acetyl-ADP-ribose deacetylase (regulator of RNase III)